jgi:hypothetical protein
VFDYKSEIRDRVIVGFLIMLISLVTFVPFVVITPIEPSLWITIVLMTLSSAGFGFGMAFVWPKTLAEKLAFVRAKVVVVLIIFWLISCLIGMVIFIRVCPRPDGPLRKPGNKITINVGGTILAIGGLYDTRLINCTFIPTDRQKSWHFDPIAYHKTRDTFSKAEWRKDFRTLALMSKPDKTITPQHTLILRKHNELWNTSMRFRIELSVTWPQRISPTRYEAKNRTTSTIVNIDTMSRFVVLTDRIKSVFLFSAYAPFAILAASVTAKSVSCPDFVHQLMHKRLW